MAYDANDPADKKIVADLIKAALAEQATEHEQDIQGLKKNNAELLKDIKKAREGKDGTEEISRLEEALAENQTKLKDTSKQLKDVTKQAVEYQKSLEAEAGTVRTLLVDNGLTEALTKANVAPAFLPAVKAMLQSKVELATENGSRVAKVGDKALGDFIKEWSQGDEGKNFITAPNSFGSGARGAGNQSKPATKSMSRADYEASQTADPSAAAAFFKEGGTLTD